MQPLRHDFDGPDVGRPIRRRRQEMAEVIRKVFRRGITFRSSSGQRLEADAFQLQRNRVIPLPGRVNVNILNLIEEALESGGLKWTLPGQQLVQNRAQAEYVRSAIHEVALTTSLFGAHVRRGSHEAGAPAEIHLAQRQTEISDKRHPWLTGPRSTFQQDISWLDVPVDQALAVGVMQ